MHPSVEQAIGAVKTGHDVQVLDGHMSAALADTVQHRHDNEAVSFFIDVYTDEAIIRTGHGADPRIRFVIPGFHLSSRLIVDFHEGLPIVKPAKNVEDFVAIEAFGREAPAHVDDPSDDRNVAGSEVHTDCLTGEIADLLLHLVGMTVADNIIQNDVVSDLGVVNRS